MEEMSTRSSKCEKELAIFDTSRLSVSQQCNTSIAVVGKCAMVKGMD